METTLSKFTKADIIPLAQIMIMNSKEAGRQKDWKKFVEWNIEHPEDLYWKISIGDRMLGYIGFADATQKPTSKEHSTEGDLFLEIYLDPKFTRLGIGTDAYNLAIEFILKSRTDRFKVFGSTYITNVRAQKFLLDKVGMDYIEDNTKFGTILYGIIYN